MPGIRLKDNEFLEAALRRFKRLCEKAGILPEYRRREFYEKPTAMRKRKRQAAVKRSQKKIQREGSTPTVFVARSRTPRGRKRTSTAS